MRRERSQRAAELRSQSVLPALAPRAGEAAASVWEMVFLFSCIYLWLNTQNTNIFRFHHF